MTDDDEGRRGGWRRWIWILLAVAGGLWLLGSVPVDQAPRFVYLVVLLVVLGAGALWGLRRRDLGRNMRHAIVWLLIGAVFFVGYSFRDEARWVLDRVSGDLTPERGYGATPTEISFRAGPGHHFSVEAAVDGIPIVFTVDTGATEVVLSQEDARRIGLDTSILEYTRPYQTANGVVMGAPILLRRVAVGPVVVENVKASVNSAPMEGSLLGMTFLSRTGGYRVAGDTFTLYAP